MGGDPGDDISSCRKGDCSCSADLDTPGSSAAQVTMVCFLPQGRQGTEGASLGSRCGPDELLFLDRLIRVFSSEALHLFALTTEDRGVEPGVQVILLNADGRLLCVDDSEVIEGADRFTEVTAAALFIFNSDLHSSSPSRFSVVDRGTPALCQPWRR